MSKDTVSSSPIWILNCSILSAPNTSKHILRGYCPWSSIDVYKRQAETLCLSLLQAFFKLCHVGIGITVTFGFVEAHAVDDGSMVQGIDVYKRQVYTYLSSRFLSAVGNYPVLEIAFAQPCKVCNCLLYTSYAAFCSSVRIGKRMYFYIQSVFLFPYGCFL